MCNKGWNSYKLLTMPYEVPYDSPENTLTFLQENPCVYTGETFGEAETSFCAKCPFLIDNSQQYCYDYEAKL